MFWTDVWCSDCSLRDWFPGLYDLEVNEEAIVFSYLAGLSEGEGRHWNPQFSRAFAGFGVTIFFFFLGVLYDKNACLLWSRSSGLVAIKERSV